MAGQDEVPLGMHVIGLTVIGLQTFAHLLIERGRRSRITRQALQDIKNACILNLKNTDASGLPIEQEAKVLGNAVKALEHFIDEAISKGRK